MKGSEFNAFANENEVNGQVRVLDGGTAIFASANEEAAGTATINHTTSDAVTATSDEEKASEIIFKQATFINSQGEEEYHADKQGVRTNSAIRANRNSVITLDNADGIYGDIIAGRGNDDKNAVGGKVIINSIEGADFKGDVLAGNGGEIIYLTQSNDFAADSYDVHAFFYLLKPVDQAKFFQILDGAVETLQRRQNCAVVVQTPEGSRRILLDHIRYVERMGRCMRYDCTSGDVVSQTIRVPFREMAAPLLAHRRFFLCGASFVLNFQHVIGVSGQTALLDNGQSITLPRTAASEFKKAWGNYWLEEDGPCWS